MKKMKEQARQGDVFIIHEKSKHLRSETRKRLFGKKDKKTAVDFKKENRIPLAYGEVSGHAHAIYQEGSAQLLVSKDVQETIKHLNVTGKATLQHEEHEAIDLRKGNSVVLIQNEYRSKTVFRTAD